MKTVATLATLLLIFTATSSFAVSFEFLQTKTDLEDFGIRVSCTISASFPKEIDLEELGTYSLERAAYIPVTPEEIRIEPSVRELIKKERHNISLSPSEICVSRESAYLMITYGRGPQTGPLLVFVPWGLWLDKASDA